jgi:hypothetical protein
MQQEGLHQRMQEQKFSDTSSIPRLQRQRYSAQRNSGANNFERVWEISREKTLLPAHVSVRAGASKISSEFNFYSCSICKYNGRSDIWGDTYLKNGVGGQRGVISEGRVCLSTHFRMDIPSNLFKRFYDTSFGFLCFKMDDLLSSRSCLRTKS